MTLTPGRGSFVSASVMMPVMVICAERVREARKKEKRIRIFLIISRFNYN
jgi:hypothetical protein